MRGDTVIINMIQNISLIQQQATKWSITDDYVHLFFQYSVRMQIINST